MKARLITLALLLLSIMAAAIWWGSPALMSACIIIFLLIIISVIVNRIAAGKIEAELILVENSESFGGIDVTVRLTNTGRLPVLKGLMVLKTQNLNFKIDTEVNKSISLKGNSWEDFTFHIASSYCGKYLVRLDFIRCYDIWGLSYKDLFKGTEEVTFLFPGSLYINRVSEAIKQNYEKERKFSGKKNSILSEILQYREYQKGDSLKNINWKLSAKHDQMLVREFDTPVDNKTLLIFDLFDGDIDYQNLTYQILFSVCLTFIRNGYSFQVCYQEMGILEYQIISRIEDLFFLMRCLMSDESNKSLSAKALFETGDTKDKYAKIIYISNKEPDKKSIINGGYECIFATENYFNVEDFVNEIKRIEA